MDPARLTLRRPCATIFLVPTDMETIRPMRRPTAIARATLALAAALLLVAGVALAPAAMPGSRVAALLAAPIARAADGIAVTSDTTYLVDPGAAVVRVTVDLVAHNLKPDSSDANGVIRYYYDAISIGVQPGAVRLRATQDGVPVRVETAARDGYQLVTISFRRNVYFDQTALLRLTLDLPAGDPRSSSDVRVGQAFASFLAWSFGDTGKIRIEVPSAFTTDVSGADMTVSRADGNNVLTASTSDAIAWYAWVNARNDAGLTQDRLAIPGGEAIVVRGWPEDAAWRARVSALLVGGVPDLVTLIGLPWPVSGPLNVLEIHTPLLEGYAGFYNQAKTEITVSEDLDALTIIHEASHAWFNDALFAERWINEGLADEYASEVLAALHEPVTGLATAARNDPAAFALEDWPPPSPIHDNASAAKETYGYSAAWTVIHQVVATAGDAGMRKVFLAAHDGTTAYVGAGAPEKATLPNDWRRFVDLAEELGGAPGTADLLATWALAPDEAALLPARTEAVRAYAALLADSAGRAAPWAVRSALDAWTFDVAGARIAEAERIVKRLAEIRALAGTVGVTEPASLEGAYVGAIDQAALDGADASAVRAKTSLDAVAGAVGAAAAPRDILATIGLLGADPDADVAAARAAWQGGSDDQASTIAAAALATIRGAPGVGEERALAVASVIVLLVLLLLAFRIRHRRRPGPGAPDRYATLPASVSPEWAALIPAEPGADATDAEQGADRS